MDDVLDVRRNPDHFRVLEVAEDELNVEAVQAVKVRGLADKPIDLPASGQEMPAEVGADGPVGPRDEKLPQVLPRRPAAAFRFAAPILQNLRKKGKSKAAGGTVIRHRRGGGL
jgi:hypothetical protein